MNLKTLNQNVRGLRTKTNGLLLHSSSYIADIYVLTETWLCNNINDAEMFDTIYHVFRRDRYDNATSTARGGGVLVAVKSMFLSAMVVLKNKIDALECICVSIKLNGRCLYLFCVYIPPVGAVALYENLVQYIRELSMEMCTVNDEIMIMGDFNLPNVNLIHSHDGDYLIPR